MHIRRMLTFFRAKNRRRLYLFWSLLSFFMLISFLVGGVVWQDRNVSERAVGRVFEDITNVPRSRVALLLGTAKQVNGRPNLFYRYRVEAAAKLFLVGKVGAILVSGDNSRKNYNEPEAFRRDLMRLGVPKEFITLDYAGFRTLDSIVRAKLVFGVTSIIIVSQRFHCERALYLADRFGLNAEAFAARDVHGRHGFKVRCREVLARTKAFLDLNVFGTQPRFLGDPVSIHVKPGKL